MRTATSAPTRARIDRISPEGSPERPRILRLATVWTIVALGVFILLQALLAAHNTAATKAAVAQHEYELTPYDPASVLARLFPAAIPGLIAFVSISACGCIIAGRGHRVLFALPAFTYLFASVLLPGHRPEPIGVQWGLVCFDWNVTYTECAVPWFGHPWLGPSADLVLMLIPAWIVMRHVPLDRWRRRPDPAAVAAILTCVATIATATWALIVIQNWVDIRTIAAVTVVGLVLGTARPWWPWLHVLLAVVLANGFGWLLDLLFWPVPSVELGSALRTILGDTWPMVAIVLVASAWQPLSSSIRRLQARPLRMVVAVNVLNVTDAVLTFLVVRSGGAYESNPFVRVAGLPLKIAFVFALTLLLSRSKPKAMVWPFAALLWVLAYHVAGLFVNG